MNAEVTFQTPDGDVLKYSITPGGTVYEIRKTGWRKVTSHMVRNVILERLMQDEKRFDA